MPPLNELSGCLSPGNASPPWACVENNTVWPNPAPKLLSLLSRTAERPKWHLHEPDKASSLPPSQVERGGRVAERRLGRETWVLGLPATLPSGQFTSPFWATLLLVSTSPWIVLVQSRLLSSSKGGSQNSNRGRMVPVVVAAAYLMPTALPTQAGGTRRGEKAASDLVLRIPRVVLSEEEGAHESQGAAPPRQEANRAWPMLHVSPERQESSFQGPEF